MRPLHLLASTSIALLVGITPGLASAYVTFPGWIQTHLELPYPFADCQACHNVPGGGKGTVTMPFGLAMKSAGNLSINSTEAEVDAALDALTSMKTDSDCNGIIDTKQLQDGRDPNLPGEYIDGSNTANPHDEPDGGCGNANGPTPLFYGCAAEVAPAAPSSEGSAALVTGLVTALGLALTTRRCRRR